MNKRRLNVTLQVYAILAFPLLGFFVFTIRGQVWAAIKSFYFYNLVDSQTKFVGLKNFITIFTKDVTYWETWRNTIVFALYKLPFEVPLALLIALLLNKKLKATGVFRTIYYAPCVVSVAVVGVLFMGMFEHDGLINAYLTGCGLAKEPIDWFSNGFYALTALVIGSVWQCIGTNILYFLGALQNVPEELYEAAYLDGMSRVGMFFKITLPLIAPVFQVILLMAINGTLQTSDYILVTTNGAPGGQTMSVMAYQVNQFMPGFASGSPDIGYGCAMAIITSLILAMVGFGYLKISNKLSNLY